MTTFTTEDRENADFTNILRREWYRLNAISTEGMSPRDIGFHTGMKSGILKAINLINVVAGAEQQDDGIGYEESTHEKQQEFSIKRNYHISNTDNPIDFPDEDTSNSR